MTRGNIVRQLVGYTIPLVLGNIFQLAYNAVDSMIAGRFIGAEALAATGMAGPVMNILILGISGICIGAGVLMSSFFGSGSIEKLKRELGTLLVSGTVFSVVLTALGVIFIKPLLTVLNVPESIHDMTALQCALAGAQECGRLKDASEVPDGDKYPECGPGSVFHRLPGLRDHVLGADHHRL